MADLSKVNEILSRLRANERELERELDRLLEEKREEFHYKLRRGRVVFERQMRSLQRAKRTNTLRYLFGAPISFLLTAPIIYAVAIPLALLDLSVTLYQHICFRVYGIPRVRRSDYVLIDRHHLAYLNAIEKFNCIYCGYGNGVIAYAREITARTEQYWCPIKHARRAAGSHARTEAFLDYGDAEAWRTELRKLREDWTEDGNNSDGHTDDEARAAQKNRTQ